MVRFGSVYPSKRSFRICPSIVESACHLGLEGVIAKRRDSAYQSARSTDWIKLKCSHRQEFVVGGWTDPKASRTGIGSLLLGVYEGGKLRYAGNVGADDLFAVVPTGSVVRNFFKSIISFSIWPFYLTLGVMVWIGKRIVTP